MVSGSSGREFGPVFRGLVRVLFRPRPRRFRLILLRFCASWFRSSHVCGCFVFYFLALRLALCPVAVVSHRLFLTFPFGVGSSCVRWFRACVSYSGVSYSDHSLKLTTIQICAKSRKKCERWRRFLTAFAKSPSYTCRATRQSRRSSNYRYDGRS